MPSPPTPLSQELGEGEQVVSGAERRDPRLWIVGRQLIWDVWRSEQGLHSGDDVEGIIRHCITGG